MFNLIIINIFVQSILMIDYSSGVRVKLNPPEGVNVHWAEKASYKIETMLATIKNLPNRHHMFTKKNYAIYVLDNYAVHLMPEIKKALREKGYVLVLVGGGVLPRRF